MTASTSMVGSTQSCTFTVSGQGGSDSAIAYFTVVPRPITYNITFADYQSGINSSATVGSPLGTFTNAGTNNFVAYDYRGNSLTCNPTATLSA